jgi:aspartate aminotransferase-like enzyme
LRSLRAALDLLVAEGVDNVFARHHRRAGGVRQAVKTRGWSLAAASGRRSRTAEGMFRSAAKASSLT